MADNTFKVSIITPERTFYEGEATMVEFNTVEGEIGVFPKRDPPATKTCFCCSFDGAVSFFNTFIFPLFANLLDI